MNINELTHSWLPATDKTEHQTSGEDELFPSFGWVCRGVGDDNSPPGHFPNSCRYIKSLGIFSRRRW